MSFGVLILIFLFGFTLFGFGSGSVSDSSSGAGSSTTLTVNATPAPAPMTLTQADSGASMELAKDSTARLRLSHKWHWSEPRAPGGAVELTPVDYVRDPGYDEWTIVPLKKGHTTITATGSPGAKRFRVTVRIG